MPKYMLGTKPRHEKEWGGNFQCKQLKYKLPQRGTLDMGYGLDNPSDLA